MPFFNYDCTECGQTVENVMVKKHDEVVLCPVCNKPLVKQLSMFNFQIEPATPRGM